MSLTTPRENVTQQVNYLRKRVTFANFGAGAITVGWIPVGASVIGGGVHVVQVFNSSGTDLIDVGFIGATTDADAYASALTLAAIGYIPFDELAAVTNIQGTQVNQVTCTLAQSVADATTGIADVIVQFVPNNDL